MQRRHTAALKMLCLIGSLNFSVRSKNNQGELKKKRGLRLAAQSADTRAASAKDLHAGISAQGLQGVRGAQLHKHRGRLAAWQGECAEQESLNG